MGLLSTIIVCIILIIICIMAVIFYIKKRDGGCSCSGGCGSCACSKQIESLVYIDGMSCENCTKAAENAFLKQGFKAKADLRGGFIKVYSSHPLNEKEISELVNSIGFSFIRID